jgi:hypothetical protein
MDQPWADEAVVAHTACAVRSYRGFTGRDLLPQDGAPAALARAVFEAPFVLIPHGTKADSGVELR